MNAVLLLEAGKEFVCRPRTIGTTEEELEATGRGEAAPERVAEIQNEIRRAAFRLGVTAHEGSA